VRVKKSAQRRKSVRVEKSAQRRKSVRVKKSAQLRMPSLKSYKLRWPRITSGKLLWHKKLIGGCKLRLQPSVKQRVPLTDRGHQRKSGKLFLPRWKYGQLR